MLKVGTSEAVSADEMWFVPKKQKQFWAQELEVGDCWIGLSLADLSGLILAAMSW